MAEKTVAGAGVYYQGHGKRFFTRSPASGLALDSKQGVDRLGRAQSRTAETSSGLGNMPGQERCVEGGLSFGEEKAKRGFDKSSPPPPLEVVLGAAW